jgi:hypothetical protein
VNLRHLITFTIRDICWLTLLVAVSLCWYIYKVEPTRVLQVQLEISNRVIAQQQKDLEKERKRLTKGNAEWFAAAVVYEQLTSTHDTLKQDFTKAHKDFESVEGKLAHANEEIGALGHAYSEILTDAQREQVNNILSALYKPKPPIEPRNNAP